MAERFVLPAMETVDRGEQEKYLKGIGGKLVLEAVPELNLLVVGKYAVNVKIVKYAEENGIEMIDEEAYLVLLEKTKESRQATRNSAANIEVLKDFKIHSVVSGATITKYQELIPPELLDVWKEYGFGAFYGGYFKTINPDEYQEILEESYCDGKISIPVLTTGFGDIIIWEENKKIRLVEYRKNKDVILSSDFRLFFADLIESEKLIRTLDKSLFDAAVSRYGLPEYDECFGFVPLGGGEKADNLQKVKIKHLVIFYLFTKLISSNSAPLLYTPLNGLSPEFIKKYELTKRQVEIAEALLQGKSNKEIAVYMNLEVNTVKVHLQSVYRKIGAPGRYALMALVGRDKIVTNPKVLV